MTVERQSKTSHQYLYRYRHNQPSMSLSNQFCQMPFQNISMFLPRKETIYEFLTHIVASLRYSKNAKSPSCRVVDTDAPSLQKREKVDADLSRSRYLLSERSLHGFREECCEKSSYCNCYYGVICPF
ncbi:hypothetical protein CEXT_8251 [Caerostris extrusa]|uniref:Uncharacterized protein n=1 Tax=Caerostris extrusa TaxID=172846 RepID=A0AAV4W768_CAEEX|nr:hypothetical protein CEXT_8251 [Caerostris extrusa]